MIAPALLTEAVAAVRQIAVGDRFEGREPNYEKRALGVVLHRVVHLTAYGWPLMGGFSALWIAREVAREASEADGCRCGGPCEHGDDMGGERAVDLL